MANKTFVQGNKIKVLPLPHLREEILNKTGTVVKWEVDDLYTVKLDKIEPMRFFCLRACEMEKISDE